MEMTRMSSDLKHESRDVSNLIIVLLNMDLSFFENTIEPDQQDSGVAI